MIYQELLEIIANPENSKVEFKLDSERPERIAKEIVAFANFRGGRIFLVWIIIVRLKACQRKTLKNG